MTTVLLRPDERATVTPLGWFGHPPAGAARRVASTVAPDLPAILKNNEKSLFRGKKCLLHQ